MVIIMIIIVTWPNLIITIITNNQESLNKCCHIRQWQLSISSRACMALAKKYLCVYAHQKIKSNNKTPNKQSHVKKARGSFSLWRSCFLFLALSLFFFCSVPLSLTLSLFLSFPFVLSVSHLFFFLFICPPPPHKLCSSPVHFFSRSWPTQLLTSSLFSCLLLQLTHAPQAQLHSTAPWTTPFHPIITWLFGLVAWFSLRVREVLGSIPRTALWDRETPFAILCFVTVNES